MRLGLFGGSFDPIHYAHLLLAETCLERCRLDQVQFLPAAVPPHKRSSQRTDGEQRIAMIELAIAGHQQLAVSRYEIDQGGISFTVNTLRHYREEDPQGELFFLLGADMLHDLPNWRAAEEICRLAIPIVAGRPGVPEPDYEVLSSIASPERIAQMRRYQIDMPMFDLTSTEIRQRVAKEQSIRYRTPRAVEQYIRSEELYR